AGCVTHATRSNAIGAMMVRRFMLSLFCSEDDAFTETPPRQRERIHAGTLRGRHGANRRFELWKGSQESLAVIRQIRYEILHRLWLPVVRRQKSLPTPRDNRAGRLRFHRAAHRRWQTA